MMRLKAKILAPVLSLALAGGLLVQMESFAVVDNAGAYHKGIADAADEVPVLIGEWSGTDIRMPPAAGQLLRPNVMFSRHYRRDRDKTWANLILVQCPDSRDMSGHYPPNCYPGNGWMQGGPPRLFALSVWGREVPVAEYAFTRPDGNKTLSTVVYNFFVLPTQGFVTSMEDLRRATGDYRARPYGAAQVQVMMDASITPEQRLGVVREMLDPLGPIIELLQNTDMGEKS